MDEHQTSQSNSSDADIQASDDLSNSILGKMKCSVSKMLPNSFAKWLSPKVDLNNSRRRRYDELDSDDDETDQNPSPLAASTQSSASGSKNQNNNDLRHVLQISSPPNKKLKTHMTYDSYSPLSTQRRSVPSSTFIEDDLRPASNQIPAVYVPHENGQDAIASTFRRSLDRTVNDQIGDDGGLVKRNHYRSDSDFTTASLSQPTTLSTYRTERGINDNLTPIRDKATNPFTVNNDSTAVNFSAHLQKSKSLFSNKSYVTSSSSRSLSNYRMRRQPSYNSPLYRSTSSLYDNNSTSSNASSVLPSPFYNGQTTFGGASSSSKRFNTAFQPDMQLQQQHRSKVPSRLVPSNLSRSTSSLNTVDGGGTSCLSTTAKRILDLMSQYNTPLADVRRVSSALPTISETGVALHKRTSLLDTDIHEHNDSDKIKRKLLKPNTPYNRPHGRTANNESFITNELNVPSMSQLLQLKKLTNNTIQVRELANKSKSILNQPDDYKFPKQISNERDLDATNNNNNNNNNIHETTSASASSKHKNKIRSNLTKKKTGKNDEHNVLPEPVNLPNVQLSIGNADIKFSTTSFTPPKHAAGADYTKLAPTKPFSFSSPNTVAAMKAKTEKNNINGKETLKIAGISTISTSSSKKAGPSTATEPSSLDNIEKNSAFKSTDTTPHKFADPIFVKSSNSNEIESTKCKLQEKMNFKFSEPVWVPAMAKSALGKANNLNNFTQKAEVAKAFGDFKFGSNVGSVSGAIDTGDNVATFTLHAKKETKPKGSDATAVAVTTASTIDSVNATFSFGKPSTVNSTKLLSSTFSKSDDGVDAFKSIATKQKLNKWECSQCLASNDSSTNNCVCCGDAKKKLTEAAIDKNSTISSDSSKTAVVDDVFKSIAAKQKQAKWECISCLTKNDQSQKECACCGAAAPKSESSSQKATTFGAIPVDDAFKSIANKQKSTTWECSACMTKNDLTKSKCVCCDQANESDTNSSDNSVAATKMPSSQFSFGSKISNDAEGTPNKSFSFGSIATGAAATPTTTFSFGNAGASSTEKPALGQFAFGGANNKKAESGTAQFTFGSSASKSSLGQFSFGNAASSVPAATPNSEKLTSIVKDSNTTETLKTSSNQFSFGTPAAISSSNKIEKTAISKATGTDDVFSKIVAQQTNKWECKSCMTKNEPSKDKCVCCEVPKDGSSASGNDKKSLELNTKNQFSFGALNNTKFSFGSKSIAPETTTGQPTFATPPFASNALSQSTSTFQFGNVNKLSGPNQASNTLASTNTFALPQSTTFSLPFGAKPASTEPTKAVANTSEISKPSGGFQFSFAAPKVTEPLAANQFGKLSSTQPISSDSTDGSNSKGITVLDNVVIKPPSTGPSDNSKAMFTFGSSSNQTPIDERQKQTSALKRSHAEQLGENSPFKTSPLLSRPSEITKTPANNNNSPFVFGQANSIGSFGGAASNSLSTMTTTTTTTTSSSPAAVPSQSSFSFGSNTANVTANTPAFATPSFSFNATPTSNPSSSPFLAPTPSALNTASPPVFGTNSFSTSSIPTLSGIKTNAFAFGSGGATPNFGNSAASGNTTEAQQPKSAPTPTQQQPAALFQFGSESNNAITPLPPAQTEQPFRFSATATPTFNFGQMPQQQTNSPFQFGSALDSSANMFAPQPTTTTTNAIKDRRKLRPVRRTNRP